MAGWTDKTAIVTGGGSGIGEGLCKVLASRGCHVVCTDINETGANRVIDEIRRDGGTGEVAKLDVTDADAVAALINDVFERRGRLDLVCNNAGIALIAEAHLCELGHWERILNVNVHGVVHGIHAAYPLMVKQGFGHILSTASAAGLGPTFGLAAYATSKHAVVGLSTSLRPEAAMHGVGVSVLCPGFIQTGLVDTIEIVGYDREKLMGMLPIKYMPAIDCARVAINGVERNKAIINVPFYAYLGWLAYRAFPRFMIWMSKKQVDRQRKIAGTS